MFVFPITQPCCHGLPVKAAPKTTFQSHLLDITLERMQRMIQCHWAVKIVMFDLLPPSVLPPNYNCKLVQFGDAMLEVLQLSRLDAMFLWVGTESPEAGYRCRCCLLVNEDGTAPSDAILAKVRSLWGKALGITGQHDLVREYIGEYSGQPALVSGSIISHDDSDYEQAFCRCFYYASSLLEILSDDGQLANTIGFGVSWLPMKNAIVHPLPCPTPPVDHPSKLVFTTL